MSHTYRDLIVWQAAMQLVTSVYTETRQFPREELYGLTSQIRKCAVSVPSNITEGQGRLTRKDFRHFLGQARGSLLELETQLTIASNLGYLPPQQLTALMNESGRVAQLLHRLIMAMSKSVDEPATRNE